MHVSRTPKTEHHAIFFPETLVNTQRSKKTHIKIIRTKQRLGMGVIFEASMSLSRSTTYFPCRGKPITLYAIYSSFLIFNSIDENWAKIIHNTDFFRLVIFWARFFSFSKRTFEQSHPKKIQSFDRFLLDAAHAWCHRRENNKHIILFGLTSLWLLREQSRIKNHYQKWTKDKKTNNTVLFSYLTFSFCIST